MKEKTKDRLRDILQFGAYAAGMGFCVFVGYKLGFKECEHQTDRGLRTLAMTGEKLSIPVKDMIYELSVTKN